jgi:hypothetical protein
MLARRAVHGGSEVSGLLGTLGVAASASPAHSPLLHTFEQQAYSEKRARLGPAIQLENVSTVEYRERQHLGSVPSRIRQLMSSILKTPG